MRDYIVLQREAFITFFLLKRRFYGSKIKVTANKKKKKRKQ